MLQISPYEIKHGRVRIIDSSKAREQSHHSHPDDAYPTDPLLNREEPLLGTQDGEGVAQLPEEVDVCEPDADGHGTNHVARN